MRPVLTVVIWVCCALLPMCVASYFYWARTLPTADIAWTAQLYQTKQKFLSNYPPEPRLLLVGGSSIHFGLDANLMSRELGFPVFNFGSHASVGPQMHLHMAKRVLRPGDWIAFTVEYENFSANLKPNTFLKDFVRYYAPDFHLGLRGYFSRRLFSSTREKIFGKIGVDRIMGWRPRLLQLGNSPPIPAPANVITPTKPPEYVFPYDVSLIDQWGDQTKKDQINPALLVQASVPVFPLEPINTALIAELREFAAWAASNRIKFFLVWPPYLDRPALHNEPYITFFNQLRRDLTKAEVQQIGRPEDFFVPLDWALDTPYHLNAIGSRNVTERLIEMLKPDKNQR